MLFEIAVIVVLMGIGATVQRGFNQVIQGLQSIDRRLASRDSGKTVP